MKKILKQVIIVFLTVLTVALVFAIIFYKYIPTNKVIPTKVPAYSTPESVEAGIKESNTETEFASENQVYEITDSETDLENNDKTMEVVVTVELIQTPVTEEEGTTTVGLKLVAIPKGGSENSGSSDVTISPVKFGEQYNLVTAMCGFNLSNTCSLKHLI